MAHSGGEIIHEDEVLVERTTYQGTLGEGVEFGHEKRDIKLRALVGWFIGLFVLMAVTFVSMWGMFVALAAYSEKVDSVPTPLFTGRTKLAAGQPRLLPNPDQRAQGPHLPWEVGQVERDRENAELSKLGLAQPAKADADAQGGTPSEAYAHGETTQPEDQGYVPALPPNAQALIAAEQPAGAPPPMNSTPSTGRHDTANGVVPEAPHMDETVSQSSGGLRIEGKQR